MKCRVGVERSGPFSSKVSEYESSMHELSWKLSQKLVLRAGQQAPGSETYPARVSTTGAEDGFCL